MNLNKNLIKKYVFYNNSLLNRESGIGIAFLNLCLQIYGIIIYRSIIFCTLIGISIIANMIFVVMFLWHKKRFNKFLYFGLDMAITLILLNCINFAHLKYYNFFVPNKFLLWGLSEIIMLFPAFQLNKYMLLKMDKYYKKKGPLVEAMAFLGGGLGVAIVGVMKNFYQNVN